MREIASKVIVRLCARAPVYHCCQRCSGPVVVVGTFWCQGTLARLRDSNDASRVLTLVFSEPKDIFTFKVKGLNSFSLHTCMENIYAIPQCPKMTNFDAFGLKWTHLDLKGAKLD